MTSVRTYQFNAQATGVMAEFAKLTLYDGKFKMVLTGYGRIQGRVPAGIYKLSLKLNETSVEKHLLIQQDQYEMIDTPETASAIVTQGFNTTHEYYTDRVNQYTEETTTDLGFPNTAESLFLFFRYPDAERFHRYHRDGQRLADGFKLLDHRRQLLAEFTEDQVAEENEDFGYMAFHAKLVPGCYFLYYGGGTLKKKKDIPPREIPVNVFPGWQTQCFMTFRGGPVFSSLVFSMANADAHRREPYMDSNDLQYLEGILKKFRNGIFYLPADVLQNLAYEKFKNPMLGLVAAYAYFKNNQFDQEDFFRTVLTNLVKLFGPRSPDILALQLLAADHFPLRGNELLPYLTEPCMMLPGFSQVLRVASENPALIRSGSIAEKAVEKLYYDMIWTSYRPITTIKDMDATLQREPEYLTLKSSYALVGSSERLSIGQSSQPKRPRRPAIMNSWVANSLMDALTSSGERTGTADLAAQIRVTASIVVETGYKIIKNKDKILNYLQDRPELREDQLFKPETIAKLENILPIK